MKVWKPFNSRGGFETRPPKSKGGFQTYLPMSRGGFETHLTRLFQTHLQNKFRASSGLPNPYLIFLALLFTACGPIVPATVPAQLDYTPGASVVVADGQYHSLNFAADYPANWHIITSPAFSQTWVVFASLDDQAVIALAVNPDDTQVRPAAAIDGAYRREEQTIPLGDDLLNHDLVVTAALIAPDDLWDTYFPLFQQIAASVRMPEPQ